MDLNIQPDGEGTFIILCPDEMEWNARMDLVDSLSEQTGQTPFEGVILDLGNVSYINSAGIGAIFSLRKFALGRGAPMVVARPQPAIRRMLQTVNLSELMPVTSSLDEARQILREEKSSS